MRLATWSDNGLMRTIGVAGDAVGAAVELPPTLGLNDPFAFIRHMRMAKRITREKMLRQRTTMRASVTSMANR